MIRKRRGVLITLIAAASILMLVGCGGEEAEELNFGEDRFYSVEYTAQESYVQEWESPVQTVAGESYVWTMTSGRSEYVYEREIKTGSVQSRKVVQGDQEIVMALSAVRDTLYVCMNAGDSVQVRKLAGDDRWETLLEISGEEVPTRLQPAVFFVDGSETVYLASEDEVTGYFPEGSRVYDLKDPVVFLQEKTPGVVEVLTNSRRKLSLFTLGADGAAEQKWSIPLPTSKAVEIATDEADTLCLAIDNRILFMDNGTGEIRGQFNSLSAGIPSDILGGLCLMSEGVLYLSEQMESRNGQWQELAQRAEGDTRTVLVYGTTWLQSGGPIQERIEAFNRTNPDYYITIREYYVDTGNYVDDLQAAVTRLQAELASGNGPDIIDLYAETSNYVSYAKQGYLEDLEPWLKQEDFYDDIFWNVQEQYRVEDGIYMVVPHFGLYGLGINPVYAEDLEVWNYEKFVELVELSHEELDVISWSSPEGLLSMLLYGMQSEFVDMAGGRAAFDTPEFVSMLELCKEYGQGTIQWENSGYSMAEIADHVLIESMPMFDASVYSFLYGNYGEDAQLYGYPTVSGEAFSLQNNFDACGIYSGSRQKEGAWEFLRTLYDEDYQMEMPGTFNRSWGIRKSCWHNSWDYYRSQEGIRINNVMIPAPTDEDEEYFTNLIENAQFTTSLISNDIRDIILEETGACFAGDKSTEETVRIIQNRVQLILDEM